MTPEEARRWLGDGTNPQTFPNRLLPHHFLLDELELQK